MKEPRRKGKLRAAIEGADRAIAPDTADHRRGTHDEDDCPVHVVGHSDGKVLVLDFCGQLRQLGERDLGNRQVQLMLFGADDTWPKSTFPVKREFKGADGQPDIRTVDWHVNALAKYLIGKAAAAGIVRSALKFRPSGVWLADDESLVLNAGDLVNYQGKWQKPGIKIGRQIFMADEPIARPDAACGPEIANLLQRDIQDAWNFENTAAGIVIIGLIFIGLICGALRWRVNGFVTGLSGSGKSALKNVFRAAFPEHQYTNDTSKAGMEQTLAGRAVVSLIDEAADRNKSSGRDLIDLVLSSSGDEGTKLSRGTVDGKGRTAEIVSSVIMFSIDPPPLQPQHMGRFVLIELRKPDAGADGYADGNAEHRRIADFTRAHARALWGRAIGAFDRYNVSLPMFRQALAKEGCSPREMDSKGALLAGWFVMTHDGLPDDHDLQEGIGGMKASIVSAEQADSDDAPARALRHLLSSHVQLLRSSERKPIGELLATAFGKEDEFSSSEAAKDVLARNGVRAIFACAEGPTPPGGQCECERCWNKTLVRPLPRPDGDRGAGIWVATRHPSLQSIFKDSDFNDQKWATALARCAGAIKPKKSIRIGFVSGYAVWLPFDLLAPGV